VEAGELLFGAATDPGQVSAALASRYAVQIEPPTSAHWTCLDTADWRLHRAGMTLRDARRGRGRRLLLSYGAPELLSAPAPARHWPRRVETLPASPVRERIAPAVGVRALLPLAEVDVRSLELRLLDDEAKTRVRVRVDQQRLAGDRHAALPLRVIVAPLRGYERDGQRCAELLGAAVTPIGDANTAVSAAFAAAGHAPGQPAVPAVQLDPDAPTVESMAEVLRRWIDIIDSVRPGALADVDIEYLHDMRTAIRATRSMLRIGGELLPPTHAARFAEEFAWLGRLTTPLRDLDVSLLEFAGGDTQVGADLTDLTPLHQHLGIQRRRALQDLRAGLASPRGSALSGEWRTALAQIADSDLPGPSTRAVAAEYARLAYRRIVKAAAGVTDQTHPDELHRLRRQCKRMRYLLDGYASVYPPGPHRDVLAALKQLQDCLGDIQDVDVQRRSLAEVASRLHRRGASVETILAIGALRERILQRDAAARRTMARRLARFCGSGTRHHVVQLGTAPE
jgi:CHAD domain-containing protein